MNCVSNFKSPLTEIRSNAVLFAGYLLRFLSEERQSALSKEHIANGLKDTKNNILIINQYFESKFLKLLKH